MTKLNTNSCTWAKNLILMLFSVPLCAENQNPADSARLFLTDQLDRCHVVSFVYLNGNDACNIFIPHGEGDVDNFTTITQQFRENPDAWQSNGLLIYKHVVPDVNGYAAWAYTWGEDNFGQFPGFDMGGATKLVFFLKGKGSVEVIVGGTNRRPFQDTTTFPHIDGVDAISSGRIDLTSNWTMYELDLTDYTFYVFKGVGQGFNNRFPSPIPLVDPYSCDEYMQVIPESTDEDNHPCFEVKWDKPETSPCWAGFLLCRPGAVDCFASNVQGYKLVGLQAIEIKIKMTLPGKVRFLFGSANSTAQAPPQEFNLTTEWQTITWMVPQNLDFSNIVNGFGLAVAPDIGTPDDVSIFIDYVKYIGVELFHDYSSLISAFKIVTPEAWNSDSATIHFDSIFFNRSRLDEPRLPQSFVIPNSDSLHWSQQMTGHTYDASLIIIALLAEYHKNVNENQAYLTAAKRIGDAFLYAQNNDRHFGDGRLRNVYAAGLHYDINGKARMPGYWNEMVGDTGAWFEDIYDVSTSTGNIAWAALAIISLYQATDSLKYLASAEWLAEWVIDSTWDDRGFTAGFEGWDTSQIKFQYTATEHCIDLYAMFIRLYNITGNTDYLEAANHADEFVKSMWDSENGKFFTGTLFDGTGINTCVIPTDLQPWYLLAYNDRTSDFTRGYHWARDSTFVDNHIHPDDPHVYKGFDFSRCYCPPVEPDGVGYEFTGQMTTCACWLGDTVFYHEMLDEIEYIQANGPRNNGKGIVAACHDHLSTCFNWEYHNVLHTGGATCWYLFAKERINPYYNPNISFDCTVPDVSTKEKAGIPVVVTIAPNPSSEMVAITLGLSSAQELSIEVMDLNGKLVKVLAKGQFFPTGSHRLSFDVHALPTGMYFISIISKQGLVVEKLVIAR